MKIADYCDSNKQIGRVCVSRISMKPCKVQGRTACSQGGLGKLRLSQKCQLGKKRPLKTVSLVADAKVKAIESSQGRAQS